MKPAWAIDEYPSRRSTLVCLIATTLPMVIVNTDTNHRMGPQMSVTVHNAR